MGGEAERLAAVARAAERGVTVFDTAPTYGDGASETLLGAVLAPRRDTVAIATKVGPRDDPRTSLEASLRRLRSDYVDLLQLHEPGERWEWSVERLHALQVRGRALAIGVCNFTHLQLRRARAIAPVAAYQGPYNLFDRDVEQRELPWCREHGALFLAYRPLAAGLLSGKYEAPPEFPEGDHRRRIYWFQGPEFARRRAVIGRLAPLAARLEVPLSALALGWVLARPGVGVVLAGARTAAQVDANLVAAGRALDPETVGAIDAAVREAFRPAQATADAARLAREWGERERFIVERLDGRATPEAIGAEWTDRGGAALMAAQVKVFVDGLAERGLVTFDG